MKKSVCLILTLILLTTILVIPTYAATGGATAQAGKVNLTSGRLNVRDRASVGGTWLASLGAGATVTLVERSGDWWRVEYAAGRYGYCHGDYITPLGGTRATVATGGSSLNVRAGAGTGYTRTGSLANGEDVIILSESGGWARVLYRGSSVGYVSASYLKKEVAFAAVKLSVPVYRQTDSRWSWVTLGSSGKTIGKIGCATTGIAMMESYRTGTTLTPATMAKRLSYTSSGNVYWPSHYRVSYTLSLPEIYRLLAAGKPVLFGAKNASGGQHWVVITGYVGGDTLTTSGFLINDPASATRKTLSSYLAVYPYFYKYFTY